MQEPERIRDKIHKGDVVYGVTTNNQFIPVPLYRGDNPPMYGWTGRGIIHGVPLACFPLETQPEIGKPNLLIPTPFAQDAPFGTYLPHSSENYEGMTANVLGFRVNTLDVPRIGFQAEVRPAPLLQNRVFNYANVTPMFYPPYRKNVVTRGDTEVIVYLFDNIATRNQYFNLYPEDLVPGITCIISPITQSSQTSIYQYLLCTNVGATLASSTFQTRSASQLMADKDHWDYYEDWWNSGWGLSPMQHAVFDAGKMVANKTVFARVFHQVNISASSTAGVYPFVWQYYGNEANGNPIWGPITGWENVHVRRGHYYYWSDNITLSRLSKKYYEGIYKTTQFESSYELAGRQPVPYSDTSVSDSSAMTWITEKDDPDSHFIFGYMDQSMGDNSRQLPSEMFGHVLPRAIIPTPNMSTLDSNGWTYSPTVSAWRTENWRAPDFPNTTNYVSLFTASEDGWYDFDVDLRCNIGIPPQHRFLNTGERNAYFAENPGELDTGTTIYLRSSSAYQVWTGSTWTLYNSNIQFRWEVRDGGTVRKTIGQFISHGGGACRSLSVWMESGWTLQLRYNPPGSTARIKGVELHGYRIKMKLGLPVIHYNSSTGETKYIGGYDPTPCGMWPVRDFSWWFFPHLGSSLLGPLPGYEIGVLYAPKYNTASGNRIRVHFDRDNNYEINPAVDHGTMNFMFGEDSRTGYHRWIHQGQRRFKEIVYGSAYPNTSPQLYFPASVLWDEDVPEATDPTKQHWE